VAVSISRATFAGEALPMPLNTPLLVSTSAATIAVRPLSSAGI
jgi:hypothetical protein